jgi:hypothetical protein
MFTAQGAQMPIRQIECKGTKKIVYAQTKSRKDNFLRDF